MRTLIKQNKVSMAVMLIAATMLTACQSATRDRKLAYVEKPVETLYNEAIDELEKRDWTEAALRFDEVERQHPYSLWARKAMLMAAYAHYEGRRYEDAIASAQRFVSLHPGSDDAPYGYYLIALSHFEQITDVGRDQNYTELSLNALGEVVRRYPESEYAKDSRLKIDMVHDQLAGKEMDVGRFYLRDNQHLAAINRFKTVLEKYETTSHTPEALHRLVEAYLSIGLNQQALEAGAVLGHNFPGTKWYSDSYALLKNEGMNPENTPNRKGWISRLF